MNQTNQTLASSEDRSWTPWAILLALGYTLVYLLPLGIRPLMRLDEVRYAEISREMILSGDWIVPHLNGLRYFEKPILGYWLNSLSMLVFGQNEFGIRFPSALAAGLTALIVFLFLRRQTGRPRTALLAAFMYLVSLEVLAVGTFAVLDTMLTLFLTAGMAAYYQASQEGHGGRQRAYLALSGALFGLAFLNKGFLAFAVPVVVVAPYLFMQRRWRDLLIHPLLPMLTAVLVALPWAIAVHLREPDYWHYFFWVEHIQRFSADNAQHSEAPWFFLMFLPALAFPWSTLLPATAVGYGRSDRTRDLQRFLLLWAVMPFLFFSASRGKLITYILPCFAPMVMLLALELTAEPTAGRARALRIGMWLGLIMLALPAAWILSAQLLGAGTPPFGAHETGKWVLIVLSLGIGIALAAMALRQRTAVRRLVLYGCTGLGFQLALIVALPQSVYDSKVPEQFILSQRPAISADTLVVSDASLIRGVAWHLERDDIYLLNEGELAYGLSYADSAHRLLKNESLASFLAESTRTQKVVIFCVPSHESLFLDYLPNRASRLQQGKFVLWTIPPDNTGSSADPVSAVPTGDFQ